MALMTDILHAWKAGPFYYSSVPELTFDPWPHDPEHLQSDVPLKH